MKTTFLLSSLFLLLAGATLLARQSPSSSATSPCSDTTASADKRKEAIDHDPLLDPIEEMRMRAQKKMEEKNFKELQDAATELAAVSASMSTEVNSSGQYVISFRVLDDLDKIEKLTKKARARAK